MCQNKACVNRNQCQYYTDVFRQQYCLKLLGRVQSEQAKASKESSLLTWRAQKLDLNEADGPTET